MENKMKILTTDLYEGAWLLSQGVQLHQLWIQDYDKKSVVFEFSGAKARHLKQTYQRGQARGNIVEYKHALNEIKDRMFNELRSNEHNRKWRKRII